jgi:hypothetical protein
VRPAHVSIRTLIGSESSSDGRELSGVTGHFSYRPYGDDWHEIALVTRVVRAGPLIVHDVVGGVCCPFAAHRGSLHSCIDLS